MFEKILIPISSEFYSKEALKRGVFLAQRFQSRVDLLYVIETKTLDRANKSSDTYFTAHEKNELKRETVHKQMHAADAVVFEDAKTFFQKSNIAVKASIVEGEFSNMVQREHNNNSYDLVLMGFEKECLLRYRLFDELSVDASIWVESEEQGDDVILSVCSNLAPNIKAPKVSMELAKAFGWKLHMLYIIDAQDTVEVDRRLMRSPKKPEDILMSKGEVFVQEMKQHGVDVTLIRGNLEKETAKAAAVINARLVVVGREQKKKTYLGLPMKTPKKKIVEKCKHSILFVN